MGDVGCCRLDVAGDWRGHDGLIENVLGVPVLHRHIAGDSAVLSARGDDRNFPFEVDEAFDNGATGRRSGAGLGPGSVRIGVLVDAHLALAVVAQARGFQDRRRAQIRRRGSQLGTVGDRAVRCGGDAGGGNKVLFLDPVLGDRQGLRIGPHGDPCFKVFNRRQRNVFKFQRHHVDGGGEGIEGGGVIERRHRRLVGDLRRRFIRRLAENMAAVAEPGGRGCGHTAELATAENTDCGAGR